jgi:hypothetical protein
MEQAPKFSAGTWVIHPDTGIPAYIQQVDPEHGYYLHFYLCRNIISTLFVSIHRVDDGGFSQCEPPSFAIHSKTESNWLITHETKQQIDDLFGGKA